MKNNISTTATTDDAYYIYTFTHNLIYYYKGIIVLLSI